MALSNRYLLRYAGETTPPAEDIERIRLTADVLDTSRKTVLVETDQPKNLKALVDELADWSFKPEQVYKIPTTRPEVKKGPF